MDPATLHQFQKAPRATGQIREKAAPNRRPAPATSAGAGQTSRR